LYKDRLQHALNSNQESLNLILRRARIDAVLRYLSGKASGGGGRAAGWGSGTISQKGKKLHLRTWISRLHDQLVPPSTITPSASFFSSFFSTLLLLCLIFGILASKRRGRDRSKSRTRSKSRSRTNHKTESPIFVHFVIPLAGILSALTARFYDMGGQSSPSGSHAQDDTEQTPLLGGPDRNERSEAEAPAKRAGKWVIRNAVLVFMSLLILAVIIVICIFFASKL
jgi:hypothetical protein